MGYTDVPKLPSSSTVSPRWGTQPLPLVLPVLGPEIIRGSRPRPLGVVKVSVRRLDR